MKAIVVEEFGAPEVLQIKEVPDPQPQAGEVKIAVRAAGVNPVETYIRSGTYAIKPALPYTPGSDAAGEIESVGAGVSEYSEGERVFTVGKVTGAYAEKICVPVANVRRLPENISFAQGAAINVPYGTAWRALFDVARAERGETVMIHGGSGGVGVAAIQLARDAGLTIIATAGSEEGVQFIAAQGAEYSLNHHETGYLSDALGATCGRGPDIILEMLANVNLPADLDLIAERGRILVIGSRGEVTLNPRDLMRKSSHVIGVLLAAATPPETKAMYDGLEAKLAEGVLQPAIQHEFALSEAPAAHQAVMEGSSLGKIVLIP